MLASNRDHSPRQRRGGARANPHNPSDKGSNFFREITE
jgi:hypothetical protein